MIGCACLGDVMGPTLNNLDKLLRLPFGCGEQNMIHFAPNVFVLKYLQKTRQLSSEVENEATDYLLQGKETVNINQNHTKFRESLFVTITESILSVFMIRHDRIIFVHFLFSSLMAMHT